MAVRESRVRTHFPLLEYMKGLKAKEQKKIIKGASRDLLMTFSELSLNLIKKNIHLSAEEINKLRPFQSQIQELTKRRHSLKKRRQIIQRGGFLSALLGAVLPALLTSIITVASKKRK